MSIQHELTLAGGRLLRVHEVGARSTPVLLWHHGSPQSGALLDPVVEATQQRGMRLLSYGRPSYGGSSPDPGRTVASAADDVEHILDALGVQRFATMGASGGGPHALACAALMPRRVTGVVTLASPCPYTDTFDWYAGMTDPGGLRAAARGREARARYAETAEFDPDSFTAADHAALGERWAALGQDAGHAGTAWPDGLVDDDVAFAHPWGFDLGRIEAPVLLVQGGEDRVIPPSHADQLLRLVPRAELWLRPRDGHISVLEAVPAALDWLLAADG